MAAKKQTMAIRAEPNLRKGVEGFQERCGFENQSKAHEELLRIGLRESRWPIMYRLRELAFMGAWQLALAATASVVVGYTTTVIHPANSILIAAVFLSLAAALVGMAEFVRFAGGHGRLAELRSGGVGQ